jgi:hypothetical protein
VHPLLAILPTMIRGIGCPWLWPQQWTTFSSDHAAPTRVRAAVGAPFPARVTWCSPAIRAAVVFRPFLDSLACAGGRVGCTTDLPGCLGGRSRLGARPSSTSPSLPGATQLVVVPTLDPQPVQARHGATSQVTGSWHPLISGNGT